jgi:hypothetical protein
VSKFKIQKAKRLGLLQLLSKEGARKREQADDTEAETEQGPGAKGAQKKLRPPTALSNKEIQSIFSNDDGHQTVKGPLPPGFVSREKNKQKAFREMLASIPVAEKAGARADISILDEATKTFNPSARSDGQGKWRVRGLQTSLMVNQVCVTRSLLLNTILTFGIDTGCRVDGGFEFLLSNLELTDQYSANARPLPASQMVACSAM